MSIPKHKIDLARQSVKNSTTDKVHAQVSFLIDLKGEKLVSETVLANYRKTPESQRPPIAVFVDKVEFSKLLDAASQPKTKAKVKKEA